MMRNYAVLVAVCLLGLTLVGADMHPKAPRLRGVMLPAVPQEEDFRFLHEKGATLVRYQMVQDGHESATNASLAEKTAYFDKWLEKRLAHLEKNLLGWGRKYGIRIVVDLHAGVGGRDCGECNLFHDAALASHHVKTWGAIAKRFRGNEDIIYGYDFLNEPVQTRPSAPDCDWWNLQRRCIEAVRAVDTKTTVIVEAPDWDLSSGFRKMRVFDDPNIVYQVHVYEPHAFTHQFVLPGHTNVVDYPMRDASGRVVFDKATLRQKLRDVQRFVWKKKSKVYVGEFGAICWAPGESAARYLADCISIFEEYGWDWTYHAFREWSGWSVEHEPAPGQKRHQFVPSADNARARVLYSGFRGEAASLVRARVENERLASACDAMWARAMKTWNPQTGVVTGCDISKSKPPAGTKNNIFPFVEGRGFGPSGVGDAPLICGTALSGLVDKWQVTKDPKVAEEAAKVARGVLNLAILHGHPGFVCRGFCSDGKSTCALSSRDQYTHWVHGLWRYVTSGMADPKIAAGYRTCIAEVARFMETRVTEARDWNFGLADSDEKDPRGVCTMWGPEVWPHEAARLPMIYAAAHLATGDAHWRALYEKFIGPALDKTLEVKGMTPQQIAGRMPCYSLFQANMSLELLLDYENDAGRQTKIREAMKAFAGHAAQRCAAAQKNPARTFYGMCWDGELLLTQLMDGGFRSNDAFGAFLDDTVLRQPPDASGHCRAAHVMAAYWRSRTKNR